MSYVSQQRSVELEHDHLHEYADRTAARAVATLDHARDALLRMEKQPLRDCSEAHVARMRRVMVDVSGVKEVSFAASGGPNCSSWGDDHAAVTPTSPDFIFNDGFSLYLDLKPSVHAGSSMVTMSLGNHYAFIRTKRMIDVISNMVLGVATEDGKLIAISKPLDAKLIERLIAANAPVDGVDDTHVFATSRSKGLIAFAVEERTALVRYLHRELWLLIPLSLVTSLVLVGVIAWATRRQLSLQSELVSAIHNDQLFAHYQPIIDLQTGDCVGGEALVRWQRPDGSVVPPNLFIPLAEEKGVVGDITDVMIRRVARDLAPLLIANRDLHVSINAAATDIQSGRLPAVLDAEIGRTNINPSQIWIEVTERGFVDADQARKHVADLRAAGYVVAIDDFGTGYSSLSLLEDLPLDILKIDKSFVDAIGMDAATSVVTPSIIKMAQALRLSIVAEGIETAQQETYLRTAGVQYAQGWLYSKALSPRKFAEFCKNRNAAGTPKRAIA